MPRFSFALLLSGTLMCSAVAAEQPCTNGSFEQMDANGFPLDWSPVGDDVTITRDAHDGQFALQLLRTRESKAAETGLNRGWQPGQGPVGIDPLSGGMDFYYKAISADAAQLMIYVIPMNEQNLERTESRRAEFRVPDDHIGDGQWHHARLKYDFTGDQAVKWVHFAARILGSTGQLLLDDISYVERVGPILRFGKPRLEEDPTAPGKCCTLRVPLSSDGDESAGATVVSAVLPPGLQAADAPVKVGDLAVGGRAIVRLKMEGERQGGSEIRLKARAGAAEGETRIVLQPRLEVVNVGPTRPLAVVGKTSTVECVLKNAGNAALPVSQVKFSLPTGMVEKSVESIPPGETRIAVATFVPTNESLTQEVSVDVANPAVSESVHKVSTLVIGPDVRLPDPAGTLHCAVSDSCAVLENARVRCVFGRLQFGWGPAELYVHSSNDWVLVAQLPRLSRLVALNERDQRYEKSIVTTEPPRADITGDCAQLTLQTTERDNDGASWEVIVQLSLNKDADTLLARYELRCNRPGRLLAFDGPVLYALARQEAVFPGLEWLVDDEVSSSTLDIAAGHADQIRYVVHPNMITVPAIGIHASWGTLGLLWDVHQKWDGVHDRPSALFASPDHFENQRCHVAGLFLPGVPEWVGVNEREAQTPYAINPDQPLRLECRIVADADATDAVSAIDTWIDWQHLPEPAVLPHGSYAQEVSFSMRGYLDSLWIPESRQWWTSKGGGIMSTKDRPSVYVSDLLVGAILSPEDSVKQACRDRAAEVLSITGGEARIDRQRFGARTDVALANPSLIAGLVNSRDPDGMWAFDADRIGTGPFEGVDYRDLGPHGAIEVGTTAQRASQVLKYARIAGDRKAYELMLPTLERMSAFGVPRAAQVWEVPVHTPDVLAASNAMDAFLEAYQMSGDRRWLEQAVLWARRGLPFIYLWDDPAQPFLVGASIPVFGATWYQGSWFGRPVQWNGLCYACSLLRLAQYDQSRDWRKLAEAIIRSGIHQQDEEGENVALWPDNLSAMDGEKCAWVFAPRQILQCVSKLVDRDEDPATVILGEGTDRLHITSTAKLSNAAWDGQRLQFTAAFPSGEQGCVVVANTTRPERVEVDGRETAERVDVEASEEPGWRYDPATGFLTIRITRSGGVKVAAHGAKFCEMERLPTMVDRVAFEFDRSTQGWSAVHDVLDVTSRDGALTGKITGPDPYVVRTMLDAAADSCDEITMRIRLTAGRGGQLFWTTNVSPAFDEAKSVYLPLEADGTWHDLRIDVGAHPRWTGQITGLRIDPGNGAREGEFAIDYIHGAK